MASFGNMDFSNLGDLMRKTQASILERGIIFKDNEPVKDVSMNGFYLRTPH